MQIFFFQAEDGIRGAQESRGLGDVYKRQGTLSAKALSTKIGITPKAVEKHLARLKADGIIERLSLIHI